MFFFSLVMVCFFLSFWKKSF